MDSEGFYHFDCPHCAGTIIVHRNELNCRIFRHGVYRNNLQPMNPHAPQAECERLVSENQIMGCGKPFQVVETDGVLHTVECGYI